MVVREKKKNLIWSIAKAESIVESFRKVRELKMTCAASREVWKQK